MNVGIFFNKSVLYLFHQNYISFTVKVIYSLAYHFILGVVSGLDFMASFWTSILLIYKNAEGF